MRQWHVDPSILCREHLLGEHVEHHMFAGSIILEKSLAGYIAKGLVEIETIEDRHNELAKEMTRRGFSHDSPLPDDLWLFLYEAGQVDRDGSLAELLHRCPECRRRYAAKE